MISISIIVILASIASLGHREYISRARDTSRIVAVNTIGKATNLYHASHNHYPPLIGSNEYGGYSGSLTDPVIGCVNSGELLLYTSHIPVSPSGVTYDEGCGPNGQYAYGASLVARRNPDIPTDQTTYHYPTSASIIMAQMENDKTGNYTGDTSELTGALTLSGWTRVLGGTQDKTNKGDNYIILLGESTSLTREIVGDPSIGSGAVCGTNLYTTGGLTFPIPSLGDAMSTVATITNSDVPVDGETDHTLDVLCSNGTHIYGALSSNIVCDPNYTKNGSSCTVSNHVVIFDSTGGSPTPTPKNVAHGSVIGTLPTDPVRPMYSFSGWYTAPTNGVKVTDTTIVNSDTMIYAQWDTASVPTNSFTTVWRVGTAGYGDGTNTVSFALTGTGNITIDWGDGTNETVTLGNQSHTYTTIGDKTIKISGLNRFYNDMLTSSSFGKLLAVTDWGSTPWTSMAGMFLSADHFNALPSNAPNLSNVTNMYEMFRDASAFNQPLDSWNVENVTTMRAMFWGAANFNQPLNSWDISKVTSMHSMFYTATIFNGDISSWNVENVTDMYSMFWDATAFNQNIHAWCVPLIASKPANFDSATNAGFVNNAAKQPQWGGCTTPSFTTVWKVGTAGYGDGNNTVSFSVAGSGSMAIDWGDGTAIQTVTSGTVSHTYATPGDKTIKISGLNRFYNSTWSSSSFGKLLTVVDWRNVEWVSMARMFMYADHLNALPFFNPDTSSVTDMSFMFYGASMFNQPLNNWDTSNVTTIYAMFYSASTFNQPLNGWNTNKITSMGYAFYSASSFNQLLNNWNTSNVVYMHSMFENASSFNQPLNLWDTSHIEHMSGMFQGAITFNQSLSSWNTSNVTNMSGMFANATSFNQSISSWNVGKVTAMGQMFMNATQFNQSLSTWGVNPNVTWCGAFRQGASAWGQPKPSFTNCNPN